jgi:GNAT superfamily N-acetyltransferase
LDGLPGRALRITDEASAERIAPGLHAAGWERRRTVLMVRPGAGGPALPAPDPRAREVGEPEHTALMRAIFAESDYGPDAPADLPELLVAAQHAQQAGLACRRFAAGEDGVLQSMCELFADEVDGVATAVVEQVATLDSHRVRGLAKAVTAAAMAAAIRAGAELIMVPADREDWPQMIYAGLGCETVGTVTSFFRAAGSAGGRA